MFLITFLTLLKLIQTKVIDFINAKTNVKSRLIETLDKLSNNLKSVNENTEERLNPYFGLKYFHFGPKPKISTLIIHQSFLEKMIKEESENDSDKMKIASEIMKFLKLRFPSIIITSGKNKSDYFSTGSKFLPFSVLEDLVMTRNPDKFLLTQILFKTLS